MCVGGINVTRIKCLWHVQGVFNPLREQTQKCWWLFLKSTVYMLSTLQRSKGETAFLVFNIRPYLQIPSTPLVSIAKSQSSWRGLIIVAVAQRWLLPAEAITSISCSTDEQFIIKDVIAVTLGRKGFHTRFLGFCSFDPWWLEIRFLERESGIRLGQG